MGDEEIQTSPPALGVCQRTARIIPGVEDADASIKQEGLNASGSKQRKTQRTNDWIRETRN